MEQSVADHPDAPRAQFYQAGQAYVALARFGSADSPLNHIRSFTPAIEAASACSGYYMNYMEAKGHAMNILILYGTTEGQTQKVANHIADYLINVGHRVTEQSGDRLPLDFNMDEFDAAIIGGSVHMGRYQGYITKFIAAHRDQLNSIPSAFFTVCMAANSQRASERKEALAYGERFVKKSGWQPRLNETFAGAVKYTQYNPITRFIMKMISKHEGGSTDTSQDHEYTDWDAVTHFAKKFAEQIGELQPV